MAESKPKRSSAEREFEGDRLPFEPSKGRKKKDASKAAQSSQAAQSKSDSQSRSVSRAEKSRRPSAQRKKTLEETRIPDAVGKRMLRRMAIFSGVPSFLGVSTFFVSYYIITHEILEFPNAFVLAISLLFFGLGVVGLSYGVLSASWEEEIEGSLLGAQEFALNFGRMRGAWRDAKEAKKAGKA